MERVRVRSSQARRSVSRKKNARAHSPRIVLSSLVPANRFQLRHPIGGVLLIPLSAQLWSSAHGGNGGGGGGTLHAFSAGSQLHSRPMDQTQSTARVTAEHGCGGGGGGGGVQLAFESSQTQRRFVWQPSGLQAGVPIAAAHAVWFASSVHFVCGHAAGQLEW